MKLVGFTEKEKKERQRIQKRESRRKRYWEKKLNVKLDQAPKPIVLSEEIKKERNRERGRRWYAKNKEKAKEIYQKDKKKLFAKNRIKRKELKAKLIQIKGKGCEICGYNKCHSALEFHHLNQREQEDKSPIFYTEEVAIKKLDQLQLLCANCHREIHSLPK